MKRSTGEGNELESTKRTRHNPVFITDLPHETLINIASHLSQADTLSLLKSNKCFERAAKVRLYKKIVLCNQNERYFQKQADANKYTVAAGPSKAEYLLKVLLGKCQIGTYRSPAHYVQNIIIYDPLHFNMEEEPATLHLCQNLTSTIKSLKNLKSLVTPFLALNDLLSLDSDITQNLRDISVNIEDNALSGGDIHNREFYLPNMRTLRLNSTKYVKPNNISSNLVHKGLCGKTFGLILDALIVNGNTSNSTLEELELNGCFRAQDKITEADLAGHKFQNDPSLVSSFVHGTSYSRVLKSMPVDGPLDYAPDRDSDFIHDPAEHLDDTFAEVFDSLDRKLIFEHRAVERFNSGYRSHTWAQAQVHSLHSYDDREEISNGIFPELHNSFRPFVQAIEKEIMNDIISAMVEKGISFPNLKRLTIANMLFMAEYFVHNHTNFWEKFDFVFPNLHDNIEVLEFRNVFHRPLMIDAEAISRGETHNDERLQDGWGVLEQANSFLTCFIDSRKVFKSLKKLVFSSSPDHRQVVRTITENTIIADDVCCNPFYKYIELLPELLDLTPELQELVVVAPSDVGLKHFTNIITNTYTRFNLRKIIFSAPDFIITNCTKLLNTKVFKNFESLKHLKHVDDYQHLCNKILKEHIVSTNMVENYEGSENLVNDEDTSFFAKEFKYLFSDEAQLLFGVSPRLEELTLFGFTFYRTEGTISESLSLGYSDDSDPENSEEYSEDLEEEDFE